ncbi:4'-phosphopantetheinyl transferase superfamily protein [Streptomyces sp. NPDC051172]|uniref:4'-phosphopantetheinyl transferase family protein n=1 Tax=Streptomyces sp. NPDC051172 TaxID=3155796 RepID=UPI00342E81DD
MTAASDLTVEEIPPIRKVEPAVLAVLADWTGVNLDSAEASAWERRAAETYPPWRRREWLIGRLTARAALSLRYGRRAGQAELVPDGVSGAPRVRGLRGVEVSLSHTGDRVACVVAPAGRQVGIDVEVRGRCDPELARRILGPGETIPAGLDPTVLWTLKEAAYKAVIGRWSGLRAYRVHWLPDGPAVSVPAGLRLPSRTFDWEGTVVALVGHEVHTTELTLLDPGARGTSLTEPKGQRI